LRFTKLNINGYLVKEDIKHQKRAVDDSAENGNVDEKTAQQRVYFQH
jgi:hypothetical protein